MGGLAGVPPRKATGDTWQLPEHPAECSPQARGHQAGGTQEGPRDYQPVVHRQVHDLTRTSRRGDLIWKGCLSEGAELKISR